MPFVLPLADAFEDGKAGLLGVGNRERFGGIEVREDLANLLFAGWAMGQRGRREGAEEGKPAAADFAVTFAEFVFVKWHNERGGRRAGQARHRLLIYTNRPAGGKRGTGPAQGWGAARVGCQAELGRRTRSPR